MIVSNRNKLQQGKFWLGIRGKNYDEDGKTLEHVIQRGYRTSAFQDIKNQTVQGSEQPVVSWSRSTWGLEANVVQWPFPICIILWFYSFSPNLQATLQHLFVSGKTQVISQHNVRVKNMTILISQSQRKPVVICSDYYLHKNIEKKIVVESEKAWTHTKLGKKSILIGWD